MHTENLDDTIAAIATGLGESGIGIVRLSGKGALGIAGTIFNSKDGKNPSEFKAYTVHYGWVVDTRDEGRGTRDARIIDEVILTVMRAPKSYTKEDVIEISCHGGIVALRAVLDLVLAGGARLAEPGEFTKRAFLNGRIDLAQAEAVLDIIRAKTDSALKAGARQLKGALSQQVNRLSRMMLDILAVLEADIDFPEEEIANVDLKQIRQNLTGAQKELKGILSTSRRGCILREGIHAVICGKPNAGKSSLLNALLKQERSIVTPIAGTTRDTIEEIIDIKGIPVRIVDTAGILEPRDLIEKKAVHRSKRHIDLADLVILVFDGSKPLSREDNILIRKLQNRPVIAVINKIDLKQKLNRAKISEKFIRAVDISAKRSKNIGLLEDAIAELVFRGKVVSPEPVLVSKRRHIEKLQAAQKFIEEAVDSLDNKMPAECICQDLKYAAGCLAAISGEDFSEGLLDKIFSEFCIGK